MYGIIKNKNSISIEICNNNSNCKTAPANDESNYFSTKAVNNALKLTKYLMKKYNVPASNVYRHYDVTGKLCPGIVGWNKESGSEDSWISFKNELESTETADISSNNNSEHIEGNKCNNLEIDSTQYENQQDVSDNNLNTSGIISIKYFSYQYNISALILMLTWWIFILH